MAQHIKHLFASLIPRYETWKINLIENWNTIIGDLHEQVTLINIQQQGLVLGVYDAAWLQELYILSPVLLKTINDYLGAKHVLHIRFKNIGYKKKELTLTPKAYKTLKQQSEPEFTPQEHMTLKIVQDSELRAVLKQYLIRCKEK